MITKGKMADLVILQLSGGDPERKKAILKQDVYAWLDNAIAGILNKDLRSKTGPNSIPSVMVKTFREKKMFIDKSRDMVFVKLRTMPITLDHDRGLIDIWPDKGSQKPLSIQPAGSDKVFVALGTGGLTDRYSAELEGNKLYLVDWPKTDCCPVNIRMVPTTEHLADDDPLPLPAGYQEEILRMASQWFGVQAEVPNDQTNNSDVEA